MVWERKLGGASGDAAFGVAGGSNAGATICGRTHSFGNVLGETWVTQIGPNGGGIAFQPGTASLASVGVTQFTPQLSVTDVADLRVYDTNILAVDNGATATPVGGTEGRQAPLATNSSMATGRLEY